MKRNNRFKFLLLMVVALTTTVTVFAQQITVSGTVQDTQGEPIIGANVLIKGTSTGIITDLDGNFRLTVDADALLVVSYIGYVTQDLPSM